MEAIVEVDQWQGELESVFARVAGRFARVDLRRRMRDYVRGLLGRATRKNGWQLAEWAGHRTPDGFQRLLNSSVWDGTPCVTTSVITWRNGWGPTGC